MNRNVERVYGDLRHHITPAIGWVRLADRNGDPEEVEKALKALDDRFLRAAEAIAIPFDVDALTDYLDPHFADSHDGPSTAEIVSLFIEYLNEGVKNG